MMRLILQNSPVYSGFVSALLISEQKVHQKTVRKAKTKNRDQTFNVL